MKQLALSSEIYFIKAVDLKKLPVDENNSVFQADAQCLYIKLNHDGHVTLCQNEKLLEDAGDNDFIKTRIVYDSYPALVCFFLTLIKPLKRRFYLRSTQGFSIKLKDILDMGLPRGERNAENAYQFKNKRFYLPPEQAKADYQKLYDSIKKNGYDKSQPLYVMLNRKFGVRDQLLQGHHRIGICKELNIDEVSIAFWAAPANFSWLRNFIVNRR